MESRKLPYPLNYEATNASVVSGEVERLFDFPSSSMSEQVTLAITLSLAELIQLASCVDVGRDIAYPDCEASVWFLWERVWSNSMPLCDGILACFNEPGFVDGITEKLGEIGIGTGGGGTSEIDGGVLSEVVADLGAGCTTNERYGLAYTIVEFMDRQATDLLDLLTGLSEDIQVAAELAENIPIFSLFASAALDTATYLLQNIVSAYTTAFNLNTHEAIACNIFCAMEDLNDCNITIGGVIGAYEQSLTSLVPPQNPSIEELALWLANLPALVDETIVASYHWLVLQVYAHVSRWIGSNSRVMAIALSQTNALPPPVGCDCVTTWSHDFDFTVSDHGFESTILSGETSSVWINGVGWEPLQPINQNCWADIIRYYDNTGSGVLKAYKMHYQWIEGTFISNLSATYIRNDSTLLNSRTRDVERGFSAPRTMEWAGSSSIVSGTLRAGVRASQGSPTCTGTAIITRIEVSGEGTDPFD